jgi:hypothetical protein
MCCPLILYREETMSGAKGLDIMKKRKEEGERRSANLEDKMLMNKSRREVHRARQTPRRRKLFITGCSSYKGNILR